MTNYRDISYDELFRAYVEVEVRFTENPLDAANRVKYQEILDEIRCRMDAEEPE